MIGGGEQRVHISQGKRWMCTVAQHRLSHASRRTRLRLQDRQYLCQKRPNGMWAWV